MSIPILIPCFNSRATILETLESIGRQSLLPSRVILADDGSTDGTSDLARSSWGGAGIAPLEVWRRDDNRGERATVNDAFDRLHEEGEVWCAVLHADDVAKPDWLETMAKRLGDTALPESVVTICSSWDDWYPKLGRIVPGEDSPDRLDNLTNGNLESAEAVLRRGCWWHFSGCFMHLGKFLHVGGFQEDLPQIGDLEWLMRGLLKGFSVVYVPRTLILYRSSEGNVSSISFRTNRDLSERLRVVARYQHDERLRPELIEWVKKSAKLARRRFLTSLARFQLTRAWSALQLGLRFAMLGKRLRKIECSD